MNNELTQKLLQLYINRDAPKSMIYPIPTEWDNKKWIGATEGHHFILIEENEENKVEIPNNKPVNIAAVIPNFNCNKSIDIISLIETYNSIPIIDVDITEDCDACDGDGKFEHYGEFYSCKTCDSKGFVGTGKTKKIADPDCAIKIGIAKLTNKFIGTLVTVLIETDCKRLVIKTENENGLNIFCLDDKIYIGIMIASILSDSNKNFVTVPKISVLS